MVVKDDYHPKNLFPWISPAHRTVSGYWHASHSGNLGIVLEPTVKEQMLILTNSMLQKEKNAIFAIGKSHKNSGFR